MKAMAGELGGWHFHPTLPSTVKSCEYGREGGAVATFVLARVGEIGGNGADSVQKQFLSGHLLSSLIKIRQ